MAIKQNNPVIPIILVSALGIAAIGFSFIRNSNLEKKAVEDDKKFVENIVTNKYEYSDSELNDFKNTVDEKREFEIEDVGLEFGEDYYVLKQILLSYPDKLEWYRSEAKKGGNIDVKYDSATKVIKPVYNTSEIKVSDLINDDLSLKHPEVFSGYIFDVREYDNMDEWIKGSFVDNKSYLYKYNKWLNTFKTFNEEYIDQEDSIKDLNKYIYNSANYVFFDITNFEYGEDGQIKNIDKLYGDSLLKAKEFNEENSNALSKLFKYYNLRPSETTSFLEEYIDEAGSPKTKYEPFPEENNLIAELNYDYVINYYPKKVELLDDNALRITLQIDAPIFDTYQANQIRNKISHYFTDSRMIGNVDRNTKDFDVIISFEYKNISNNMFDEFDSFSIFAEGTDYQDDPPFKYNDLVCLYQKAPWYPNEYAQTIIKDVFASINTKIVNNESCSIFEIMKDVSKTSHIDYKTVENIVISYIFQNFIH